MFSKSQLTAVALSLLSLSEVSFARERWLERDGRSVQLYPRRFGREHPPVIDKLSAACSGAVCGTLAGAAITPLLAAQGECTQQDMADSIIDAAQQFDAATKANMIALAQEYRQAEKNTPPDFTTNPPTNRNSVFCQKAPKNAELNGLVQAQDPANDPNIFFDPATKASVKKGAQANTSPFGTSGAASNSSSAASAASSSAASSSAAISSSDVSSTSVAATLIAASSSAEPCVQTITVTAAATDAAATTSSAVLAVSTASSAAIGNFGSCSVPQIEFATGFDNRKETSFQPVDKTSYNHGSAQGIDIITKFICDTLTNSCGADATAKATCATASAAADAQAPKTGAQADAFNAAFGITTSFTTVPAVDDQGKVIAGSTGTAAVAAATTAAVDSTTAAAVSSSVAASTTVASAAASTSAATTTSSSAAIGNFGSCSVPQIEFATGFDNRKETSFQPVDKTSFNHGSAQNIDIITQFICDTLTNSCGADATAKATCQSARTAADTKTAKTGAQADAFNAVFGITTDFSAVAAVDDQGNVIAGSSTGTATGNAAAAAPSSTGIGNFGSCTVPQIEFATGFDNRKETSFQPVDKTSYSHGSAQNIDIITQFICDTLTNSCKADATAKATCQSARTAADTKTAKTGAQADAFNAVFGITTNFAAVSAVDDQGNVIAGSSTGSTAATSSAAATTAAATTSAAAASSSAASSAASSSAGIGNFGSCTVPQIEFATGFDNRKETSFQPVDQTSFNHGSAQNIDIITQFICDTLTNSCGADATAKATCQSARAAADTKTAKTGAQADAFNAAFGIKTDFSAVAAVDNQGNVIAGSTA